MAATRGFAADSRARQLAPDELDPLRAGASDDEVELTDYGPLAEDEDDDEVDDDEEDEDGGGRTALLRPRRKGLVVKELALNFTLDTTANQRTQWAWTRTALGMISLGLSLTHIFTKQAMALGLVFILLGAVYGVVASARYFYFFKYVDEGKFRTNGVFVTTTTLFTLAGLLCVLFMMYFDDVGEGGSSHGAAGSGGF